MAIAACNTVRRFFRNHIANHSRLTVSFVLPFVVYLLTLAPTIYNLDSAELTTAAATLGLTRSTGYPLYVLLGKLWSFVPVGDVGYRMNLLSAIFGALTIHLADRVLLRWKIHWTAAVGGLGLLAVSPYFWGLSSIAEVYTLHTALMAGIMLSLQRWDEQPTPRRLACVAACVGLSLVHHAASVLLIPGTLLFLLISYPDRWRKPAYFAPAVAVGMLALSLFFYLPLRSGANPTFHYAGFYDSKAVFHAFDLADGKTLFWFVSGQPFSGLMFAYTFPELAYQLQAVGKELVRAFFVIGIGPGFAGFYFLFQRNRKMGLLLLLWFFFISGFYGNYRAVDKATMYLPLYLVWAISASVCYDQFLKWLDSPIQQKHPGPLRSLQGFVLLTVLAAFLWNWPLVDQSDQWKVRISGEQRLTQLPANAAVIGYWDTIPVMEYLQKVEGMRPDVLLINRFLIPNEVFPELIDHLYSKKAVFVAYRANNLPSGYRLAQEEQLYRVIYYQDW